MKYTPSEYAQFINSFLSIKIFKIVLSVNFVLMAFSMGIGSVVCMSLFASLFIISLLIRTSVQAVENKRIKAFCTEIGITTDQYLANIDKYLNK